MQGGTADVLSRVLLTCRSERAVSARFTLSAPWALRSEGVEGLLIRVCTGQPYWLQVSEDRPLCIQPRDIVLLPQGRAHTVSSAPGAKGLPFRALIERHMRGRHGDHPIVFAHGGGGETTELFSLHLWMPVRGAGSVLSCLPPVLVLRAAELQDTASLALVTESLITETLAQAPGWQLTVARMADLLLVHVLRRHLAGHTEGLPGWALALGDPMIAPAIACLHAQPERAWTVEQLSHECHVSRSVFSERFKAVVGSAPMAYLASLRMQLAAEKLRGGMRVGQTAAAVGYASEKTFARAFQRWSGETPGAYARRRTRGV